MSQTLLLVDDREANLMSLEVLLDDGARTLLKATSAQDGLKMMLKNAVDIAILDVNMPEMGGYEMAEIMRSNPKTEAIPILFVTADDTDKKQEFAGFDKAPIDYVYKPINPDLLEETVEKYVN